MDYAHYIDGSWVDDSERSENINPSNTDDIIGRFARGDAGRVDEAVAAAKAAQPAWADASPQVRHDVLEKAGALVMARKDELSGAVHDLVMEMGGSFSAEHGIGQLKNEELRRYREPVELDLMRSLKATLDPKSIMNPGKVL